MVRYSYLFGRTVTIFFDLFRKRGLWQDFDPSDWFPWKIGSPRPGISEIRGFFWCFLFKKNHRKKEEQKVGKKWCFTCFFSWIEGQVKPRKTTRTHETGRETHPGLPSDGVSCAHPHCIIDPDEISTKKLHRLSQVIINDLWYGIVVMIIYYHY